VILKHLLNRPAPDKPTSQFRQGSPHRRTAGVVVNEDTALTYSAVYLSVKIISETLGALPGNVFTREAGSDNRKVSRGHSLKSLLLQPNSEMTGFTFLSTLVGHAALRGGGFAFIGRDRSNRPGELQLITPDRVNKGRSRDTGKIIYEISNGTDANSYYGDNDIFHLPGMGFDGLTGYSVVSLAARSFGLGMAQEQFGNSFFENGAQLGTIIEVPPEVTLDEDGKELLLDSFDAKHRGVAHFNRTAIIDAGMKVSSMGIPQKDAQFIESRKFSITDVARWFNMPPHKLKDLERATFSNIEEQNIDFVQDTLMPWITSLEQTINWKLMGRNNRSQFFKFNVNALMRGDSKSRAEYYKTRFDMGTLSINEIKALEDENGIGPDGDEYFMQMAMTTVDNIVNPPEPVVPNLGSSVGEPDENEGSAPDIENAISKIVFNVNERVNRTIKKGIVDNTADALPLVLVQRREYIEAIIHPIMPDGCDSAADVSNAADIVTNKIADRYFIPLDDLKNELIGDFTAFCATITETKGADDES